MNRNQIGRIAVVGLVGFLAFAQAQQPLSPEDDWIGALQAGGNVTLGAGAFYTTTQVLLGNSLSVTGQGAGVTSLWFASDGGEYKEQLVLLPEENGTGRFEFSDLDISNDSQVPSDLITIFGDARLTLNRVTVNFAFDDYAYFEDNSNPWHGVGLLAGGGATVIVNDSIFYGNATNGITAAAAGRIIVEDSTFQDNKWAGIMTVDTPVTVTGSHFLGNDVGVEIYGEEPATMARNTFQDQKTQDVFRGE